MTTLETLSRMRESLAEHEANVAALVEAALTCVADLRAYGMPMTAGALESGY